MATKVTYVQEGITIERWATEPGRGLVREWAIVGHKEPAGMSLFDVDHTEPQQERWTDVSVNVSFCEKGGFGKVVWRIMHRVTNAPTDEREFTSLDEAIEAAITLLHVAGAAVRLGWE